MIENIKERLEYLRTQIEQECISTGEIIELQSLKEYIDDDDVVLLEWAGVPEFEPLQCEYYECKKILKEDEDLHTHYDNGKEMQVCLECWEKFNN